jgi:excisionase family DNA binding protein
VKAAFAPRFNAINRLSPNIPPWLPLRAFWHARRQQSASLRQADLHPFRRRPMTKTPKPPKPELPTAPRLLTIKNVAERLQVSPRTIHRLVASGDLTVIRIGRAIRVSEEALKAFLTAEDRA